MDFNIANKEYVFPEPLHRKSKNRAEWIFEGDSSNIEKITSTCGCTTPTIEDNKIVVFYNSPERTTDVLQKIYIWFNDGLPLETINPQNGQKIRNYQKSHIELTLKGNVL